jgi:putative endonuclease
MASGKNGTLYVGVTNNLTRRVAEHTHKTHAGFTAKYSVGRLMYFEETSSIESAIHREKQLKNWRRQWKTDLINKSNPEWKDLLEADS